MTVSIYIPSTLSGRTGQGRADALGTTTEEDA
jgi:hypothetical protein